MAACLAGAALGVVLALYQGRLWEASMAFAAGVAAVKAFGAWPKAALCPYCGFRGLSGPKKGDAARCDRCGSRFERDEVAGWRLLSCPGDDRAWAATFLPKLRGLRSDLRPGGPG